MLDLAKPQITAAHQSVKAKLDEHVDDCAIDASQCDDAKEGGCETKEDEKVCACPTMPVYVSPPCEL